MGCSPKILRHFLRFCVAFQFPDKAVVNLYLLKYPAVLSYFLVMHYDFVNQESEASEILS